MLALTCRGKNTALTFRKQQVVGSTPTTGSRVLRVPDAVDVLLIAASVVLHLGIVRGFVSGFFYPSDQSQPTINHLA